MIENPPSNQDIAAVLDQIAELLSIKQENPYKIGAYRDAAKTVRKTDKNIANIVQNDPQSLEKLKRIGKGIKQRHYRLRTYRPFWCPGAPSGRGLPSSVVFTCARYRT
jgi:DNA polymerase/3'-5' exonuclease PolX